MTKDKKYEFTLASINSFLAISKGIIKTLQSLYKEISAQRNDMPIELKEKLKTKLEEVEVQKHHLFRYVHWLNLANQQYSSSRSIYIHEIVNNVEQINLLYAELKNFSKEKITS